MKRILTAAAVVLFASAPAARAQILDFEPANTGVIGFDVISGPYGGF